MNFSPTRLMQEEQEWKNIQKRFNTMHATGLDATLVAMKTIKSSVLTDLTAEELSSLDCSDAMKAQCPRSLTPSMSTGSNKATWAATIEKTKHAVQKDSFLHLIEVMHMKLIIDV